MIFETFSLRLSWSTDGSALLGANSYQPPSHCAAVLHREKWESPLTIVGHRGAVTVISFNPMLFKSREDGDTEPAECFALGAQVRSSDCKENTDAHRFFFPIPLVQTLYSLHWKLGGKAHAWSNLEVPLQFYLQSR